MPRACLAHLVSGALGPCTARAHGAAAGHGLWRARADRAAAARLHGRPSALLSTGCGLQCARAYRRHDHGARGARAHRASAGGDLVRVYDARARAWYARSPGPGASAPAWARGQPPPPSPTRRGGTRTWAARCIRRAARGCQPLRTCFRRLGPPAVHRRRRRTPRFATPSIARPGQRPLRGATE